MKGLNIKRLISSIAMVSTLMSSSVFADNPYGIVYSGGEELGAKNVQINPTLIDGLTPLTTSPTTEYSNSNLWENGYLRYSDTLCSKVKFFKVWQNNQINASSNLGFNMIKNQYKASVQINNVYLENVTGTSQGGKSIAVVVTGGGGIEVQSRIYTDAACTNQRDDIAFVADNDGRAFIQFNLKLYKNGEKQVFKSDQLYFGITDIDAVQSYKILNNPLTKNNMYAKSAATLQSSDPTCTAKNMYVSNGNYIYSGRDGNSAVWIDSGSDVFAKIPSNIQENGLDIVFGFATDAGSGVHYYAKQYKVIYSSDKDGKITGITDESIISGQNPSGSSEEPNEGYELKHWIADKDVTLTDGTIIKAGQPITPAQIKQVVVNSDLEFTAIHVIPAPEPTIPVPNTGSMTEEQNAEIIGASLTILGIVAFMGYIGMYIYKRQKHHVKF